MKLVRLLSLSMHRAGYIKSRCVVWFMMSLFVPSVICLYWVAAIRENPDISRSITQSSIVTYYITMITLSALLVTHLKEQIMRKDIQNGELARYLLRPFSYYWYMVLFLEIPYRVLQGTYGVLVFTLLWTLYPHLFQLQLGGVPLILGALSGIMGFFICSNIEMVLGLLAFWFYDLRLLHNAYEVVFILLGGLNIPLYFFPKIISDIAFLTPLPAIVYIPTLFITRQIPSGQEYALLGQQLVWLVLTTLVYRLVWHRGILKFTAAGI